MATQFQWNFLGLAAKSCGWPVSKQACSEPSRSHHQFPDDLWSCHQFSEDNLTDCSQDIGLLIVQPPDMCASPRKFNWTKLRILKYVTTHSPLP
jgi:hypothetical protein